MCRAVSMFSTHGVLFMVTWSVFRLLKSVTSNREDGNYCRLVIELMPSNRNYMTDFIEGIIL